MSALPPKADIGSQARNVRFVPKADIGQVRASGPRIGRVQLSRLDSSSVCWRGRIVSCVKGRDGCINRWIDPLV